MTIVLAVIPAQAGIQSSARAPEGRMASRLEYLNQIGIALSQERDINKLLERLQQIAGTLEIGSSAGGTIVRALVPRHTVAHGRTAHSDR